jgi:heptosyltransferase-2/heptosyltransferase-3
MIGLLEPRTETRRIALELLGRALPKPRGRTGQPERVLVIRPDHLGDLLFLTPALQLLRRGLPEAEIVALVGTWGVPVLDRNPNVDRVIAWDFPWFDRRRRRSVGDRFGSLARLAAVLAAQEFDLAIQFRADFWWGALAVRLAGVPAQLGYDVPEMRALLTRTVPLQHGIHAARENLRLAEVVAGPSGDEALDFPIRSVERDAATQLLGPDDGSPIVAIQAGAGAAVKLWPPDRLGAVGRALRREFGARVVVIGGNGERDLVAAVADGVGPDTLQLAGRTSLGELAAALERCALVFGPDSGPLHLAVAVDTPTVHLFGPADARRFGPFGDPTWHRVVQSPWPCCPCNRLDFDAEALKLHRCLSEIPVDQVTDVCADLLRQSLDRASRAR